MQLDKIICVESWRSLYINNKGQIFICCYMEKTKFYQLKRMKRVMLGNIMRDELKHVWNSKKIKLIREEIIKEGHKNICMKNCPFLFDHFQDKKLVEECKIKHLKITNGYQCNLNCVMCLQKHSTKKNLPTSFYHQVMNLADDLEEITMSGGETFAIKESRDFFMNFDFKKHPKIKFNFITNGQLLTSKIIERMILHCNYINISIDSADKILYENIRIGAKWEKIIHVFEEIKKYQTIHSEKNPQLQIILSFVIMKKNFREMNKFIELCKKFGFNSQFDLLEGNKPKGENLLRKENKKELKKLYEIILNLKKEESAHLKSIEKEIKCHLKK